MMSFAQLGNALYSGERDLKIVSRRRIWFTIAIVGLIFSVAVLGLKGINQGIEFRGGTEFTISGAADTSSDPALEVLGAAGVQDIRTAVVGGSALRIQTEALNAESVERLRGELAAAYGVDQNAITSTFVGPAWGADVTGKAIQGLVIFLVLVTLVMAMYFRSWRMSIAGVTALLHDLIMTVGIYALIGFEVTPASVIGFLTILGYSLYDTVVVFDKVRENTSGVLGQLDYTYEEGANLAVNQTVVRSINTSIVGLLPVASILFVGAFLLGAGTLKDIALALFIGMLLSVLSSIFLATPLEVVLRLREPAIAEHTATVLARRGKGGAEPKLVTVGTVQGKVDPQVTAGGHKGTGAQPKRKNRSKR